MAHKKSFCIGGLLLAAVGVPESRGEVLPDQSWVPNVSWQERCVGYNPNIVAGIGGSKRDLLKLEWPDSTGKPSAAGDFLLDGVELTCESDVRVGLKVVALRHGQKRDQISLYSFQDRAVSVATISLVVPGGASITFVDPVDPAEKTDAVLLGGDRVKRECDCQML